MASGTPDYQPAIFKLIKSYSPGSIYQVNGSVDNTGTTITIPDSDYSTYIWIQNNTWDSMEISLDGGTTYAYVAGKSGFEVDVRTQTIIIRAKHSTRLIDYNVIVGYE